MGSFLNYLSPLGIAITALSAFFHRSFRPLSSLWHFTGLSPGAPCLSSTGDCRIRHRTPAVAPVVLKERLTFLSKMLETFLHRQLRIPLTFTVIFNVLSTKSLRSFSAEVIYSQLALKDVATKNYFSFLSTWRIQKRKKVCHINIIVFPFRKSKRNKCMRLQLYTTIIWN